MDALYHDSAFFVFAFIAEFGCCFSFRLQTFKRIRSLVN